MKEVDVSYRIRQYDLVSSGGSKVGAGG